MPLPDCFAKTLLPETTSLISFPELSFAATGELPESWKVAGMSMPFMPFKESGAVQETVPVVQLAAGLYPFVHLGVPPKGSYFASIRYLPAPVICSVTVSLETG